MNDYSAWLRPEEMNAALEEMQDSETSGNPDSAAEALAKKLWSRSDWSRLHNEWEFLNEDGILKKSFRNMARDLLSSPQKTATGVHLDDSSVERAAKHMFLDTFPNGAWDSIRKNNADRKRYMRRARAILEAAYGDVE